MKKEYNPLETAQEFSISHADISKTAVSQCQNHTWRILNDKEIACIVCPTVNIVDNANDYATK